MKRTLAIGLGALVALGAACNSKDKGIEYGAPQAPNPDERAAATNLEWSLQGSLGAFVAPTQPEAGSVVLADQLAADLGANSVSAAPVGSAKLGPGSGQQAIGPIDTTGCVTQLTDGVTGDTTVTWSACHVEDVVTDTSGVTTSTTFDLDGWMKWQPALRTTSWFIVEAMDVTQTGGMTPMAEHMTATLDGATHVTDSTITADATSTFGVRFVYPGMPTIDATMKTVLDADLGYQADPFCITSGTLLLERTWPRRPVGATEQSLPDQGWKLAWTGPGCGTFTVAHGS